MLSEKLGGEQKLPQQHCLGRWREPVPLSPPPTHTTTPLDHPDKEEWGEEVFEDDAGDEEEDVDDDGESNTNMMIIPLREYANGIETSPQSFIIFSPNRYFSLMIFDHLWMDEARW